MDATAEMREFGRAAAKNLCGHLRAMGAEKATIPIETLDTEFLVTVEVTKYNGVGKCPKCGQVDKGQVGKCHCAACGLPTEHAGAQEDGNKEDGK